MVESSKWIEGASPSQPVSEVARRAMRARLATVWHFAPLAAKKPNEDIEHVHQLRVATRRARAALQIFTDLLPTKGTRWMKKTLRQLRHAAGDARDLDVLGERLTEVVKLGNSGLKSIVAQIAAERERAQRSVIASYESAKSKRFKKRSRRLVQRIVWRGAEPEPQFGEAAGMSLGHLVHEFFEAATASLTTIEALHAVRICGKQLRYGMELLAGAFEKSFQLELYPVFAAVQEQLGTINDHATAVNVLNHWFQRTHTKSSRAALAELIASEEHALAATSRAFRDCWTIERAADLRSAFDDILHPLTVDRTGNDIGPCDATAASQAKSQTAEDPLVVAGQHKQVTEAGEKKLTRAKSA